MNIYSIYRNEINEIDILSEEEEKTLMGLILAAKETADEKVIEAGKKAEQRLILAHIKLVGRIVKMYENSGVDNDDLISEGVLGLYKALEKYKVEYGYRFSTYAQYHIKNNIRQYINKCGTNISLDACVDEDGENSFIDMISDDKGNTPEEVFVFSECKNSIIRILNRLDEKAANIIKLHYGFYGERKSLETIGAIYGISKERVRQIEAAAIKSIRRSPSMMREIEFEI